MIDVCVSESQFDVNIYRKLQDEFVTMNATSINVSFRFAI